MMTTSSNRHYFLPKFWIIWLSLGVLRIITCLPHAWRMHGGALLGRCLYPLSKRRRHIAKTNIALCFPHHTATEQEWIMRKHFESLGKAAIEMGIGWWETPVNVKKISHINGLNHLETALSHRKGVILLSAHFTILELGLRILHLNTHHPLHIVYQKHKNPLLEKIIYHQRVSHVAAIAQDNIRQVIRVLRRNEIVWYAPDQGYNDKHSALVPFFGIPAQSNTATSRLAKLSGATVLPFIIRRIDHEHRYEVTIEPPMPNFPSDDAVTDTLNYHHHIERAIKQAPEQYLWVHRRFKKRPANYPDLYRTNH